jgi:hypothetical protein
LRVGKVEDRLGVLWHYRCSDLFVQIVKIKFYLRQELTVFLVPSQRHDHRRHLQPEQYVNVLHVIALLNQLLNHLLHLLPQHFARCPEKRQVHLERELYRRNVRVFLCQTLPIQQSVAKTYQIAHLVLRVLLLHGEKTLQQANEKLRPKQIIVLVDPVQKPTVLKNVKNDHGSAALLAQRTVHPHDVLASQPVHNKATELLLNVFCYLQKTHANVILYFEWKAVHRVGRNIEQGNKMLQVLFLVRNVPQHCCPLFYQRSSRLERDARCDDGLYSVKTLDVDIALVCVFQNDKNLLHQQVHNLLRLRTVCHQATKSLQKTTPDPGLELFCTQYQV